MRGPRKTKYMREKPFRRILGLLEWQGEHYGIISPRKEEEMESFRGRHGISA